MPKLNNSQFPCTNLRKTIEGYFSNWVPASFQYLISYIIAPIMMSNIEIGVLPQKNDCMISFSTIFPNIYCIFDNGVVDQYKIFEYLRSGMLNWIWSCPDSLLLLMAYARVLVCDITATHCNTLQHTATHCNTLQHTATHCNTLGNDLPPPTLKSVCQSQQTPK